MGDGVDRWASSAVADVMTWRLCCAENAYQAGCKRADAESLKVVGWFLNMPLSAVFIGRTGQDQ